MADKPSRAVTQGAHRAPNRAMLRAVGFGDADFEKPIVGIANAYSNLTPCNLGIDSLAKRAGRALTDAGDASESARLLLGLRLVLHCRSCRCRS